jgi:starvation-inducible DNA-binding protein
MTKPMLQEKLSVVVADTYVTLMLTQKLHWHVTGSSFYSIHKMTQEQYEEMQESIDMLAEHMRTLGYESPSGMKRYSALTTIEEHDHPLSTCDASLEHLIEAHGKVRASLNAVLRLAQEHEDVTTEDMMVERMRAHDKHVWMLASSISSI